VTKLASFMLNSQNRSLEIDKGFNNEKFREAIRTLLLLTGKDGIECTFLFTDT